MIDGIVKICKRHGGLTAEQAKPRCTNKNGTTCYDCRLCLRVAFKKYYWANKEKCNKDRYKRPSGTSEKTLKQKAVWRANNRDKMRESVRKKCAEYCANLSDTYVRWTLAKSSKILKTTDFKGMDDLIALKRATLLIKRELEKNEQH